MERRINMDEVSDGKMYSANDMVKVGCNDCEGCSKCCHGMGSSITLDPYDIYNLTTHLECGFETLLQERIELNVVDGIILPNLKLSGADEGCSFLNEAGRCSIHQFRPGICRLFPLGRIYEDGSFKYFLQVNECVKDNRTKVKVKKWLGIPDMVKYEQFITRWHYFLKDITTFIVASGDDNLTKQIDMYILQSFFVKPYEADGFYEEFDRRMNQAVESLTPVGIQIGR